MNVSDIILGGCVLEICGNRCEEVISLLAKKNLDVWNIEKKKNGIKLKSSLYNRQNVIDTVHEINGMECKKIRTYGFLIWLWNHRLRSGFTVGFLLFFISLIMMFSVVWSVDISGIYSVPESELRECLSDCGLYPGAFIVGHNIDLVRLEIMRKFDEIAYVTLNFNGCRLYVEVEESTVPPSIVDKFDFCNIVASRDGVLIECNTYQGVKQVKVGDAVKKGDLLVSGVYPSKVIGYRLVRSDAEMLAYTRRDYSVFVPYKSEVLTETGNTINKYTLKLFDILLDVPFTGTNLYQFYDINTEEIKMTVSDTVLPVSLISEEYRELEKTVLFVSENDAELLACKQLDEEMRIDLFGLETVSVTQKISVSENGVTVSRICTVIENIAESSPIIREIKKK